LRPSMTRVKEEKNRTNKRRKQNSLPLLFRHNHH
jgi:hypothetical protein